MLNLTLLRAVCVRKFLSTLFLIIFAFIASIEAQEKNSRPESSTPDGANDPKAEQIVARAIEKLGGNAYLNVRSLTARGYFTQFAKGVTGLPLSFVDYIIYPDRERTEFKGAGVKSIQTNTGETGWLYDGEARTIKDMSREQVDDFRFSLRTNIDYLLRGFWRKESGHLTYVGRREAGIGRRNETVRLTYPDGLIVEFEFGAQDGLPAKALYQRKNKEGLEMVEEDRFAQFLTINGVTMPFVIDHYRAGAQSSRINYQSVEINQPLSDSLFARPANVKAIK